MSEHDELAMELQTRMSSMRKRICARSEQLAGQTRAALSWRNHVVSHPWAAAAVAMAVGYWLVPVRRSAGGARELKSIGNMLEQNLAAVDANSVPAAASNPSPLMAIGRSAIAAVASQVMRHVAERVMQKAALALDGNRGQGSPNKSETAAVAGKLGGLDD